VQEHELLLQRTPRQTALGQRPLTVGIDVCGPDASERGVGAEAQEQPTSHGVAVVTQGRWSSLLVVLDVAQPLLARLAEASLATGNPVVAAPRRRRQDHAQPVLGLPGRQVRPAGLGSVARSPNGGPAGRAPPGVLDVGGAQAPLVAPLGVTPQSIESALATYALDLEVPCGTDGCLTRRHRAPSGRAAREHARERGHSLSQEHVVVDGVLQPVPPWAGWGSNPRPTDYESAALTAELPARVVPRRTLPLPKLPTRERDYPSQVDRGSEATTARLCRMARERLL